MENEPPKDEVFEAFTESKTLEFKDNSEYDIDLEITVII